MNLDRRASRARILITAAILASSALAGSLANAEVLYQDVRVSDPGTTDATIANGNTSRKLAVGTDGTIYAVYRGNSIGVRVARSSDRGQTFSPSVQVSATNTEAEVIVSSTGIVYVAWIDGTTAKVSRSLDGAQTFSAPVDAGTASSSLHLAVDANRLYIIDRPGNNFLASSDNGLTFSSVTLNASQAFSDVHVDSDSGDVFVQVDDPSVKYFVSSDYGATFPDGMIYPTPAGSIFYSVGALSISDAGRYLLVSGNSNAAMRINLDTQASETLTFGMNNANQGRSLTADRCGNVVDGYVASGSNLAFHVSNDVGDTFGPETVVTNVPNALDQQANVFINQTNGDLLFLYSKDGEVFLSSYSGELPCYQPQLDTSTLVYSALLPGMTSAPKSVLLTNTSDGDLEITGITATGEFEVDTNTCVGTLAPGASCEVPVRFQPSSLGAQNGQLQIATNDFPQPRIVSLRGESVANTPVPEFGSDDAARLAGSFGTKLIGVTHSSVVTLTNEGNQDLTINGFSLVGDAFAFTHDCPATLAPGASCNVTVTFSPTAAGDFSGTLTLDSNTAGAPATLALKGTGTATLPQFEVTASAGTGGAILPTSVMVNESQSTVFTITPQAGYSIASVTGCGGTRDGNNYTTAAVTAGCSVSVTFNRDSVQVDARGTTGGGGSMNLLMLGGLLFAFGLRHSRKLGRALGAGLGMMCALPGLAQADDGGHWYVGADIGSARSDRDEGDVNAQLTALGYDVAASVDDSRTAWGIHGGYRWSQYFALQAGYTDLGDVKSRFTGNAADIADFVRDANVVQPMSADGFDVSVIGSYPVFDRLSVTAQLGAFYWSAESELRDTSDARVRREDDGRDLVYGVGLDFALTKQAVVTAGWKRYDLDDESVDMIALGARYQW